MDHGDLISLGTKIPITFPKWSHRCVCEARSSMPTVFDSLGCPAYQRLGESHWLLRKWRYWKPSRLRLGGLEGHCSSQNCSFTLSSSDCVSGMIAPHRYLSRALPTPTPRGPPGGSVSVTYSIMTSQVAVLPLAPSTLRYLPSWSPTVLTHRM